MEGVAISALFSLHHAIELVGYVIVPFEIVLLMLMSKRWFYGDTAVNLACGALIALIFYWLWPFSPTPLLNWVRSFALFDIEFNIWTLMLHVLVGDLCFYWSHRLMHTPWLFALDHSVHHSSSYLNFSTSLRHSPLAPLYGWTPMIVPMIFGFNPLLILASFMLANALPILCHTEHIGKLGWLEKVFNTPSHHRVHHAKNPVYIDKNFAGLFIIWDKLFGTFAEERERVEFGVAGFASHEKFWGVYAQGVKSQILNAKTRLAKPTPQDDRPLVNLPVTKEG